MSDSEATAAEGPEAAPEIQDASPAETPDSSTPDNSTDNSTDVAPTRRGRRRPDVKPAAEVEETPKVEEQPLAKAEVRYSLFILDKTTNNVKKVT